MQLHLQLLQSHADNVNLHMFPTRMNILFNFFCNCSNLSMYKGRSRQINTCTSETTDSRPRSKNLGSALKGNNGNRKQHKHTKYKQVQKKGWTSLIPLCDCYSLPHETAFIEKTKSTLTRAECPKCPLKETCLE